MATSVTTIEAQPTNEYRIIGFFKNTTTGKKWIKECNDSFETNPFLKVVLEAGVSEKILAIPAEKCNSKKGDEIVKKLVKISNSACAEIGGVLHIFDAEQFVPTPDVF